ncbi:MAG: hypothetical protein ABIR91_05290 [Candidatus Saccharimonadales bacterium]
MRKKDETRNFRMVPLRERNWAMMVLTFLAFTMTLMATLLLFTLVDGTSDIWMWVVTGMMAIASILSLIALITGDTAWFLISLLISWNN